MKNCTRLTVASSAASADRLASPVTVASGKGETGPLSVRERADQAGIFTFHRRTPHPALTPCPSPGGRGELCGQPFRAGGRGSHTMASPRWNSIVSPYNEGQCEYRRFCHAFRALRYAGARKAVPLASALGFNGPNHRENFPDSL